MQKASTLVVHPLKPVYDKNSRALILGTMPSPKSREYGFYYSHPQNRFWRVAAGLYNAPVPETNEEKASFLLQHRIAMWDVLKSCRIAGADDASIREPVPNDIAGLLKNEYTQNIYNGYESRIALPPVLLQQNRNGGCSIAVYKSGKLPLAI